MVGAFRIARAVTLPAFEDLLHPRCELIEQSDRYIRLNRSGEPAPVDAHRPLALKNLLAEGDRQTETLLGGSIEG